MGRRGLTAVAVLPVVGGGGAVWWLALRRVAAYAIERRRALPGDPGPRERAPALVSDRAIAIAAPVAEVWSWVVQMGYRRAGWYSHDRLEALLGAADYRDGEQRGTSSSWVVIDDLQDLAAGDAVPLGPGADLLAEVVDPPHDETDTATLLLTGTFLHSPVLGGPVAVDWRWSWHLRPVPAGTRLHVRTTVLTGAWLRPVAATLLRLGHAEMERAQLTNIRDRAERRRSHMS